MPNSSSNLIVELFDAMSAGNITETKLIRTMDIEKKKTIQLTIGDFFSCVSICVSSNNGMQLCRRYKIF